MLWIDRTIWRDMMFINVNGLDSKEAVWDL